MRNEADLHTLTGAYALHALSGEEHAAFTAHLAQCGSCRQEVAEFGGTTARLAAAVSAPPPARMKDAVMHGIDSVRQVPPRLPAEDRPRTVGSVLRRKALPLALAASVAAAAAFGGLAVWQQQQAEEARQQAQGTELRMRDVTAVLAAPDARTVHGRTSTGAVTSVVGSQRLNRAVFVGAGLPEPGPGRTYQLWYDDHGTMRPAGLLDRDGATLLQGDLRKAVGVGLTLEPAGGSPQPTSAPLMLLALPA
ncbi:MULTISPECIES: anti-sigma factor [unclassified Streptomyces]|uniref:anti-sigma factor n=1 Tax=unclassified Streptomyces TaxID=2593676 RepID=UPI00225975F1|nr:MULTISPECIES: anti-sigma factor [unclassified Streptomyces]MCX4529622.1 anti-sigma factor [Streptomyces sp. NBC_01551]MCX4539807.1 anti-sigma factor [Streptomyces sp. NBC_01565]